MRTKQRSREPRPKLSRATPYDPDSMILKIEAPPVHPPEPFRAFTDEELQAELARRAEEREARLAKKTTDIQERQRAFLIRHPEVVDLFAPEHDGRCTDDDLDNGWQAEGPGVAPRCKRWPLQEIVLRNRVIMDDFVITIDFSRVRL